MKLSTLARRIVARHVVGHVHDVRDVFAVRSLPPHVPDARFVIFGIGRSGSTLLVDLLNKHPDVYCDGEIFNKRSLNEWRRLSRREHLSQQAIYGFKLLSYQLKDNTKHPDKRAFIHRLVESGYRILHLRRENVLRQALSYYKAARSNWHQRGGAQQQTDLLHVDTDELLFLMRQRLALQAFERSLLDGFPHLVVGYERDLEDAASHRDLLSRISQFLPIEDSFGEVASPLRKLTPKQTAAFVSNVDEIRSALNASGLGEFVEYL